MGLEHLIHMDFAGMKFFVDDVVASWTMKQRWRWAWKGRVSAGLEMLQESHPGKTVNAVAIRGGPQCEWEVTQLMPGGEVRKQYPEFRLMVFDQLDDFVQAVEGGAFGDVQNPASEDTRVVELQSHGGLPCRESRASSFFFECEA